MTLSERYRAVLDYFEQSGAPDQAELHYRDAFTLLVAVMLSAQCTDRRVNMTTPALFDQYPTPDAMAAASVDDILSLIKSISYPNSKAKHLSEMSKMLVERYHSIVPDNRNELTALPGVGRKTANVVLAVWFGQPAMAVDTHVLRVADRIGLTTNKRQNPLATELTLTRHIPPQLIPRAHHWLILHGRYTCTTRNPKCDSCGISPFCRYFAKTKQDLNL